MPHFVIEYSEPAAPSTGFSETFEALCRAAVGAGVMKREDIKLRAVPYRDFQLNDGSDSFLHLTVSLLEGRTPDQKEALGIACRAALVELFPEIDAISVDIRDMNALAYKKRVKQKAPQS
ncbi:5-carboxymethyl-2-hydroxymuconate isomerase [uncultured Roseibium sp.]|uniref:5-carboxymethyl-2-hydroxymuconate Delta-isomerase n=1 Tax=uncultured Roseibium sp. TaxID=1936171 RepID=UPI003217B178